MERMCAGIFRIDRELIDKHPDIVKKIMGQCIIVRAEMMFIYNAIEYHAYSDYFEIVEKQEMMPLYEWHFDKEKDILQAVRQK